MLFLTDIVDQPLLLLLSLIVQYKGTAGGGFFAGLFRGGSGVPQGGMLRSIKFTAASRTSLQASKMAHRSVPRFRRFRRRGMKGVPMNRGELLSYSFHIMSCHVDEVRELLSYHFVSYHCHVIVTSIISYTTSNYIQCSLV